LSAPKPSPDQGFLRVSADRKVNLSETQVDGSNVSAKVK
jgi:hypothetical protein